MSITLLPRTKPARRYGRSAGRRPAWRDHAIIWIAVPLTMLWVYAAVDDAFRWKLSLLVTGRAEPAQPFDNCSAAHAAGIYSIPRGSPAYTERQDGDFDDLACEPVPGSRF